MVFLFLRSTSFGSSAFITRCLLTTFTSLLFLALEKFVHCLAGAVQVFSNVNVAFNHVQCSSWWTLFMVNNNAMMYFIVKCVLFRSQNTDPLDVNKAYSRQAKEHISKWYFTPGNWSQLFLTLPLGSVRRSQAIFEDIHTAHILTVPIAYHFGHFVICIFTSIASNFFKTSKLTQKICLTSQLNH